MEIKTKITSALDEPRIKQLFPTVIDEMSKGHSELSWNSSVMFHTELFKNGGVIYLRENSNHPLDTGRYDSYSMGMIVIDKNGCDYYEIKNDMGKDTLSQEERESIISKLGPKLEKKNDSYNSSFEDFVNLAADYNKEMQSKVK